MKLKIPVNADNWFKPAIAVLALIFLFISVWAFVRTSTGVDFYISWIGVMSVREQKCVNFYETEKGVQLRESFYRRSLEKAVPPRQKLVAQCWQDYEKIFYKDRSSGNRLLFFFNTPFLYTCIQLFVSGDYERDISLYCLTQLACFIFFIMIVMYLLNFPFVSSDPEFVEGSREINIGISRLGQGLARNERYFKLFKTYRLNSTGPPFATLLR